MNIRFWGVRGSIATSLTNEELIDKIKTAVQRSLKAGLTRDDQVTAFVNALPWDIRQTAGGNTACVEVQAGDTLIILDAGTGIRSLGLKLFQTYGHTPINGHILLSHTHWDHICGIPFFEPAFVTGSTFKVYGPFPGLEERFRHLQDAEFFPVSLAQGYIFIQLNPKDKFQIDDVSIETMPMNHPGGSNGYRITHKDKTVVYATDSEYKDLSAEALKPFIDFFSDADVLIFDAQYTMLENVEKENWGHSNVFSGIDIASEANVKKLYFTHHDPAYDDQKLWGILKMANEYLSIHQTEGNLETYLAVEGQNVII